MHVSKVAAPTLAAAASAGAGSLLAFSLHHGAYAFSLNAVIPSATTSRTSPSSSSSWSPCSFPTVTAAVASLSAGIVPSSFYARTSLSSSFNSNFLCATPGFDHDGRTSSTTRRQTEKQTSMNTLSGVAVDSSNNAKNKGIFRGLVELQQAVLDQGEPVARHAKKIITPVAVALAWYLASATVAGAAEAISGGMSGSAGVGAGRAVRAMKRSDAKKHAAGLRIGTILCLYVLSSKNIKKRNRFDGVVPKDAESRKILADDAHDNAMSYGRPAGRVALLGVDLAVAMITFLYTGNALRSYAGPVPRADVAPWNPLFWDQNNVGAATLATICTLGLRLVGHGYIRYSLGVWLAPMALSVIVKPVKRLAFFAWGIGGDWDLGPTAEERARMNEGKMTSRQLRESLSTFEDPTVEFREQDPHYHADGDYYDDEVDGGPASDDGGDAPPDLRRSS